LLSVASPGEDRKKIYSDVASFKAGFDIGIMEERNIDINSDGKIDVLIFSSGGEETFLDLLIKEQNHFIHIDIPVGKSYDIVENPQTFVSR
jgi:hypothetical protein